MRIESQASVPCAAGSCGSGPASPQRFAEVREQVRAQRPDRLTLTGAAAGDRGASGPTGPIDLVRGAASGEPTDPEAVGLPGGPRGAMIAAYSKAPSDPGAVRLQVYA